MSFSKAEVAFCAFAVFLLLAFTAWVAHAGGMPEQQQQMLAPVSKSWTTEIVIACITTVGVIGAAWLGRRRR